MGDSGPMARIVAVCLPILFVLIWSSGYLVGTIGATGGATFAIVFWRFLVAFVVLGVIALVTRAPWPREPRVYGHLLVTGVLLQTVQLGCVYLGLSLGVPAGLSSLIVSTCPLIVAALAVPMFAERLAGRQWLGLALGLVGVAVSLSGRLGGGGGVPGYALTVAGLAGVVAGTLYQKRFGQTVDLRSGTVVQLFGATVASLPIALAGDGLALPLNLPVLAALAWLSTVNSIGAFLLLFVLLRRRPGGAATSLLYLVPPTTAVLGVPLLGQSVSAGVLAGMAISGAGVLLVLDVAGRIRTRSSLRRGAGSART